MLFFPFVVNWTSQTWAYAATIDGGKYLDAAAYYSSLGLVMDVFWLVVVLFSWRVLTRDYWLDQLSCRPTNGSGRSSVGASPNAACWRCTDRSSSTACAG